jgi:hypothetical protein
MACEDGRADVGRCFASVQVVAPAGRGANYNSPVTSRAPFGKPDRQEMPPSRSSRPHAGRIYGLALIALLILLFTLLRFAPRIPWSAR